jgi:hypothetical protein
MAAPMTPPRHWSIRLCARTTFYNDGDSGGRSQSSHNFTYVKVKASKEVLGLKFSIICCSACAPAVELTYHKPGRALPKKKQLDALAFVTEAVRKS